MQTEETSPCSNCGAFIPDSKLMLHELYCERNCKKCDTCGKFYDLNDVQSHEEEFHKKLPVQPVKKPEPPQQQNKKEDLSAIQKKMNQMNIEGRYIFLNNPTLEASTNQPVKQNIQQPSLPSRNDYTHPGSQTNYQAPSQQQTGQSSKPYSYKYPQTNTSSSNKQKDEIIPDPISDKYKYSAPYTNPRNEPAKQFQEPPRTTYDIPKSSYDPPKDLNKQTTSYKSYEKDQDRQPPSRFPKQEEQRKPESRQAQDRQLPRNDDLRKQPSKEYGKNEPYDYGTKDTTKIDTKYGNKYSYQKNPDIEKPTSKQVISKYEAQNPSYPNRPNIPQTQPKKDVSSVPSSNKPVSKRPDTAIAREIQAQINLEQQGGIPSHEELGMTEEEYANYVAYEQSYNISQNKPKPLPSKKPYNVSNDYMEDEDEILQKAIQESMKRKY